MPPIPTMPIPSHHHHHEQHQHQQQQRQQPQHQPYHQYNRPSELYHQQHSSTTTPALAVAPTSPASHAPATPPAAGAHVASQDANVASHDASPLGLRGVLMPPSAPAVPGLPVLTGVPGT